MRHASRYALDSMALFALYVEDHHTAGMIAWRKGTVGSLRVHRFLLAEVENAIAGAVFRKDITQGDADGALADLAEDLEAGRLVREDPPWRQVFDRCSALTRTHTANLGVRTLDMLHVACALEMKVPHLVTYDEQCAKLAQAVGVKVEQPGPPTRKSPRGR